jgi:hypothetical protein
MARIPMNQETFLARGKRIAELETKLKECEAWGKKARIRIRGLEELIKEVRDHVDPTKKDVVLAVKTAKGWVTRAVKILRAIF